MNLKEKVGRFAVAHFVHSGQIVGLGTGSTAIWAVRELGERLRKEALTRIYVVPTSMATEMECHRHGLLIVSLNDPLLQQGLDLCIDGADCISPRGDIVKGGGAAHLKEKLIAYQSQQLIIVVTEDKLRDSLDQFPIPVEVLPEARQWVTRRLEQQAAKVVLRTGSGKIGPLVTDSGNIIVDVCFPRIPDAARLEQELAAMSGVVESGIFAQHSFTLLIAKDNGEIEERTFTKG